jgi:hypothetical protein
VTQRWFARRRTLRTTWLVAILAPLVAAACLWVAWRAADGGLALLFFLNAAAQLALGGLFLMAVRNRGRPVIELSNREVLYGSIFRRARRRLEIAEIVEVGGVGRAPLPALASLPLTTRSGERVRIGIGDLSPSDRRAVRAALERVARRVP